MANVNIPKVDLIVLTRRAGPLHPDVERGLRDQHSVELIVHHIVGEAHPSDSCRYETIARARNVGKLCGNTPWLMFVDDDVVLEPTCVSKLANELRRRPVYGALAADYLGEHRVGRVAPHVAMGATLFRRDALAKVRFTWQKNKCECQCCCDELRRLHAAIDYYPSAKARHLPKGDICNNKSSAVNERAMTKFRGVIRRPRTQPSHVPSVCLVACYFGPVPGWIKQFLLSCAYNPSIDFLIFTDQEDFPNGPANVHVKRLTMSSFNELATNKLGMEIGLSHPRKVCDFKPAYGHLFEEYLQRWDYWGYTDLDVVYGDIRRFLSNARLHEYEVLTARKEYLVGHFTLFRNTGPMRMLYQQSADFRATAQSPQVRSFDECGKQWHQRLQGKTLTRGAACDSMTHVVQRLMGRRKLSACFAPLVVEWPELARPDWRLRWNAGRLWFVDQRREAMYVHFHAFKDSRGYRAPRDSEAETFEISPKGFERVR